MSLNLEALNVGGNEIVVLGDVFSVKVAELEAAEG